MYDGEYTIHGSIYNYRSIDGKEDCSHDTSTNNCACAQRTFFYGYTYVIAPASSLLSTYLNVICHAIRLSLYGLNTYADGIPKYRIGFTHLTDLRFGLVFLSSVGQTELDQIRCCSASS